MEMLIIILAIVLCVIVGLIAYKIGRQKTVEIATINNDKLKEEQKQLIQENERIKQEFEFKQNVVQNAEAKKAKVLQEINDLRTIQLDNLEEEYEARNIKLQEQYKLKEKSFQKTLKNQEEQMFNDFEEKKLKIKLEAESLEKDLEQMRKARKATIEANKRAAAIQENKENYSLQISAADANDIKVMESIRHLLVKPRILSMLIWQTYFQPLAKKVFPIILGQEKVCGIYKITNTQTEECYIGQSTDCRVRWNNHCKHGLGIDTPEKNKLYAAMQQYGLENFTFELLEECDPEELNERERYYIDMFNSVDFGYNGVAGNNG